MNRVKILFKSKGLKATAQRVIVYQVMTQVCHAPVDEVVRRVHEVMPTITVASVYNILESLSEHGLISKLFTADNRLYYDITASSHHHLYGVTDSRIEDYDDPELTVMLTNHFAAKSINGFTPEDIRVQIIGTFKN